MRITTCAAALAAALATSSIAHGAAFDLTFVGATYSVDATLDATSEGGGEWLVTGMTGTISTNGVPGSAESVTLIPGGPGVTTVNDPYAAVVWNYDNLLYYPSTGRLSFDSGGLLFSASGSYWNLCTTMVVSPVASCGSTYTLEYSTNLVGDSGSTTVSQVPEPSTWAMIVTGFTGLAFAGYRSRRSTMSIA
jgi:hypothetical protein